MSTQSVALEFILPRCHKLLAFSGNAPMSEENLPMISQKIIAVLCFIYLGVSLVALRAQPTAVQQAENFKNTTAAQQPLSSLKEGTNAPEIYTNENEDIGPQHILRIVPRPTLFEVKAASQYLYTDNGLLSAKPAISTTEFVNTISAAYAPTPRKLGDGRFAPGVGYMSQWYNYGLGGHDLSALDFNVQTAFINAKYLMANNWQFFGDFSYN